MAKSGEVKLRQDRAFTEVEINGEPASEAA